jgi:hypothetical protein
MHLNTASAKRVAETVLRVGSSLQAGDYMNIAQGARGHALGARFARYQCRDFNKHS